MRALPLLLLLSLPAGAKPALFDAAKGSTVTYTVVHKFHTVHGVSHSVEGKVRILASGVVQAMVRIPVTSFDSGNANRDAHMKEVTEVDKYPYVELKGVSSGFAFPAKFPATRVISMKGLVVFHGVQKPVQLEVTAIFQSSTRFSADAPVKLRLSAFQVKRPSLLFIKIHDELDIRAHLVLQAERT